MHVYTVIWCIYNLNDVIRKCNYYRHNICSVCIQILMSVLVESMIAVSMHSAPTLWAATTVLAMLAILEMGLIAVSSSWH